jgi:hemolysin III
MEPVADNLHVAGITDPVAAGTHLFAFVGMLGGLQALVRRTALHPRARILVVIYALSQLVQYAASTAYHVSDHNMLLRQIDHSTIYVLIAGSFTAIAGLQVRGVLRLLILIAIWISAIVGVVIKVFFFDSISENADIAFYLGAGWFGTVPTFVIWRAGERKTTAYILFGAIAYSVGALCELNGWPHLIPHVFNFHEVFHVCVMLAGASMFVAVWRSLDDRIAARYEKPVVITRRSA